MKKTIIIVLILFFGRLSLAQDYIKFQSYLQARFTTDFDTNYSGEVRRLKFYLRNGKDFYPHWSYLITAGLYQRSYEHFILHDVRLAYQYKNIKIYLGQFIPAFSLQRFQSDWNMPVLERSEVVRYLQPNGTLGIRDVGTEIEFQTNKKQFCSWLGIFNGRGTKQWLLNNNFMIVGKMQYDFLRAKDQDLILGMSYSFRRSQNLSLPKILPDTMLFTGIDRRWNMFFLLRNRIFSLQGEYIKSDLYDFNLWGYYLLSTVNLNRTQFVLFYENFCNSAINSSNCSRLWIGNNFFIDDNYFRISNFFSFSRENFHRFEYIFQIQIFLAK